MALEIVGALAIAALVLWLVFGPAFVAPAPELLVEEPEAAEESRRGLALLALREIEFDRETGKLSDGDYQLLKERYSAEALSALAAEEIVSRPAAEPAAPETAAPPGAPAVCTVCGPRPEADATFCSNCGRRLSGEPQAVSGGSSR